MICFFAKGSRFVQCEIHPGQPHVLRVIEPSGTEHVEHYASPHALEQRWSEIATALHHDGWLGPLGRDGRA